MRRTPSFVIDKPHIDSRTWGWMMEESNVDGLLNWGFNRWGKATTGNGWRDPYRNPLSLVWDTCAATATPASSIRATPALRARPSDGRASGVAAPRGAARRVRLREYLKIAKTYSGGPALVDDALGRITQFPYKIVNANVFNFPKYTHSNATFDAQRARVAAFIEAQQQ